MDELKNRKTTRLKGADHNRNQAVFLTICTKERRGILSRIVGTGVLDGPRHIIFGRDVVFSADLCYNEAIEKPSSGRKVARGA